MDGSLPPVGVIGLGVMGRPMAGHLLAAGHPLVVHTRTRERATDLLAAGATWAATPAELAATVTIVLTVLPDSPDVVVVARGPGGLLAGARPGGLWVDLSTISPVVARELATEAGSVGLEAVDAPVSGGERGAREATLAIMAGGSEAAVERARPILERLGRVVRVGGSGAGQVAKAANQLVVGGTIALVAEALVLARAAGVDPAAVRDVLLGGFASSRVLDVHGRRMLERTFEPGFRIALQRKDLAIGLALAETTGAPAPMAAAAAERFATSAADGDDEADHSAAVLAYERIAGHRLDEPVAPAAADAVSLGPGTAS